MCYNFDFLKKEEKYKDFTYACIEAEKSLVVSYASTAILARRALELAVKWVFSYDHELEAPYQDNLASLIHDYRFKGIIDTKLFPMIKYIQQIGNKAVHSAAPITREQAVLTLHNLFEFVSWIDYCYSDEYIEIAFDESLLGDNEKEKKTRDELKDLYDRLGAKDRIKCTTYRNGNSAKILYNNIVFPVPVAIAIFRISKNVPGYCWH